MLEAEQSAGPPLTTQLRAAAIRYRASCLVDSPSFGTHKPSTADSASSSLVLVIFSPQTAMQPPASSMTIWVTSAYSWLALRFWLLPLPACVAQKLAPRHTSTVGVGVGVFVGEFVGIVVGVGVRVSVGVGVGVSVGIAVGVSVGIAVGVGVAV